MPPLRRKEVVVNVKPRYSLKNTKSGMKDQYYQQKLILHAPWRTIKELMGEAESWHAAYDKIYPDLNIPLVFDSDDVEVLIPEEVAEEEVAVETDPYHFGTHGKPHPPAEDVEQDDWMATAYEPARLYEENRKAEMLEDYDDLCQDPNFDWKTTVVDLPVEMADSFIQDHRLLHDTVCAPSVLSDTLNADQLRVFERVTLHAVCDDVDPLIAIVLGFAGTGKSHVIHSLRTAMNDRLVVLAPTGVAACNVYGNTIHSKLAIPVRDFHPLSTDALMDLQSAWSACKYIVIDEISMVGQKMMGMVDSRLRQIFPDCSSQWFGGRSMLFFGDLGQLSPVCDRSLYIAPTTKAPSKTDTSSQGRLAYLQISEAFFLDTVVRQSDDATLRDILLHIHDGKITKKDWETLVTRCDVANIVANEDRFQEATRLFPKREQVYRYNLQKLKVGKQVCAVLHAVHPVSKDSGKSAKAASDEAGGLEKVVALCVGARVMLTHNMWVEMGLVNGSVGFVRGMHFLDGTKPPTLPAAVFVHFPDYKGPTMQPGNVVPVTPRTFHWVDKHCHCNRTQIPLSLAWSMTIHKAQGLTMDCAVIDLGHKEIASGLTYVALSRVRHLVDLCLASVNFQRLQNINESQVLQKRMAEEKRFRVLSKAKK
jgi:ATP-dependent DNA helicase PIF1